MIAFAVLDGNECALKPTELIAMAQAWQSTTSDIRCARQETSPQRGPTEFVVLRAYGQTL
jgi:hypothetical protein